MRSVKVAAKDWLKWTLGEWGYRQSLDLKNQLCDRRIARLLAKPPATAFPASITEAFGTTPQPSGIVDHLGALFFHTVTIGAKLVVELGTRGGDSTRAFLAAVAKTGGAVLSIDLDDCSGIDLPPDLKQRWQFIRADDVAFGRDEFAGWCQRSGSRPQADVIFIDTSHLYEHTLQEIDVWHRLVAPGGMMMFHDTNMGEGIFRRYDGTLGGGWNNDRGVIRAIEEFMGRHYDERTAFIDIAGEWIVRHDPYCNGLTVLLRAAQPLAKRDNEARTGEIAP